MNIPLITLEELGGDSETYLEEVYKRFCKSIIDKNLTFLGLPLKCRWHAPYKNKHFSFWHVISEEGESKKEDDRRINLRRCERIEWIGWIIENHHLDVIYIWKKPYKNKERVLLYLYEYRYLVILEKAKYKGNPCYYLITAYVVDHEHRHKQLLQEKDISSKP